MGAAPTFSLILLVSALAMGADPVAEPGEPRWRLDDYPRRIGIDVDHYRFELGLSDETDRIDGVATVSVRFTNNGVSELPLDLIGLGPDGAGMEVSSVTAAGQSLAFTHESDLLTIQLAAPGRVGERLAVSIEE